MATVTDCTAGNFLFQRRIAGAFDRIPQQERLAVTELTHDKTQFSDRIKFPPPVSQIEPDTALFADHRHMQFRLFIQRGKIGGVCLCTAVFRSGRLNRGDKKAGFRPRHGNMLIFQRAQHFQGGGQADIVLCGQNTDGRQTAVRR